MDEVIIFLKNSDIRNHNKERIIIEYYHTLRILLKETGVSRLQLTKDNFNKFKVVALSKVLNNYLNQKKIYNNQLRLKIIGDVNLDKYKERLTEVFQTLYQKGHI